MVRRITQEDCGPGYPDKRETYLQTSIAKGIELWFMQ
jgi:hypothetical protein